MLERKDVISILINYLAICDIEQSMTKLSNYEKAEFSFKLIFIELFLSKKEVLDKITDEQGILIIKQCLLNYNSINKFNDVFGLSSRGNTARLVGKILVSKNYDSFAAIVSDDKELKAFINDEMPFTDETIYNFIIEKSNELITNREKGETKLSGKETLLLPTVTTSDPVFIKFLWRYQDGMSNSAQYKYRCGGNAQSGGGNPIIDKGIIFE